MIIDPIENRLGISTYLIHQENIIGDSSNYHDGSTPESDDVCSTAGFTAISKARFSDFIVHEGTNLFNFVRMHDQKPDTCSALYDLYV